MGNKENAILTSELCAIILDLIYGGIMSNLVPKTSLLRQFKTIINMWSQTHLSKFYLSQIILISVLTV